MCWKLKLHRVLKSCSESRKVKKALMWTAFIYTLHRTVPDEKLLKGRIESGMISLKQLLPPHAQEKLSATVERSANEYRITSIKYYPWGTSTKAFALSSLAHIEVDGERFKLFGIVGTWFKV